MERLNDFIAWITGQDVKDFIQLVLVPASLTMLSVVLGIFAKKILVVIFEKFTELFNKNKDLVNEYKNLGQTAYDVGKATFEKVEELKNIVNIQDKTIAKQDKLFKMFMAIAPISVQQKTAILDLLLEDVDKVQEDDRKFVETLLNIVKGEIEQVKDSANKQDETLNEAIANLDKTEV